MPPSYYIRYCPLLKIAGPGYVLEANTSSMHSKAHTIINAIHRGALNSPNEEHKHSFISIDCLYQKPRTNHFSQDKS